MKQFFSKQQHQNFIDKFNIKENPSRIEIGFYKKTEKYINFIKWIPGIKMIGIGNSISMNCSSKDSDIDLYIVTKHNRIWLVRIIITFIFQILGVRKNNKKHAGRFCLSFFSTLEGMDFNNFKIENDIYLYFWLIYFKPILNYDNTYNTLLEKNKSWADLSNYENYIKDNKKYIKYEKDTNNKEYKIFDYIENILKNIFLKKSLNTYKEIGEPYGVIISNDLLKFHNGDIRRKIKEELVN